ncbi:MAG: glycosyltransferase [Patescibacteria group bacterium]
MQLTLITVNFNNARATVDLLRALEKQSNREFDVIVVDNDSQSDDRVLLGSYAISSPLRLDIIYSDRNRGFSGGNNLAIRKALVQESEWICLINNDTTVAPDFIASLVPQLPPDPTVIGIALKEGNRIAKSGIVRWLRPTLPHIYNHSSLVTRHLSLAYAIGAGMLVHREVFEKIGLLDERYFLYFEDADFCMRAQRADVPLRFLRHPIIMHGVSQTTQSLGSPLLLRYHMRNAILFNRLNGPLWARTVLPFWALFIAAKQSIKLAVGHATSQSRAMLAGIKDAIMGCWGYISTARTIAIECESLEDTSWGVARMIRGLLEELTRRDDLNGRFIFDLYFKARVPDESWLDSPLIRTHIVRAPAWLPVPVSFSLYYYVLLPLRLWWDRPSLTYWPNYMLPIIAPRPSLVMLTEDVWHEMRNPRRAMRYKLGYRVFATWASKCATRIMAISHASKQELHRLFRIPLSRIVVNKLAVDIPTTDTAPMPGKYILFVGQALERRHLREAIEAFTGIAPRYPDMRFVAIGPDKYEPPVIDALIAHHNRIIGRPVFQRIEHVSDTDLKRFYAGANAIVYVSEIEAFGLPPLEALSYGVPAVLADTALTREIYGEHAFFAPSCDTEGIAIALERALSDETARSRIRDAAQSIIARYSWKAHADRMLAIIEDIIAEK